MKKSVRGRHIPFAVRSLPTFSIDEKIRALMPPNWDCLDVMAAGIEVQTYYLARILENIYNSAPSQSIIFPEHCERTFTFHTLGSKLLASGFQNLSPTVHLEINHGVKRQSRGAPRKRLRQSETDASTDYNPLLFGSWVISRSKSVYV